ncbi:MAG TPA: protein phosphatase 2C domain-containing protein [Opitutaceae bacterium]|nr:protein phosphatase 2C domain-containing protein [Opitutaceae bacterium]
MTSPIHRLDWAAQSDQGLRRQNNEDAWSAVALGESLAPLPAGPVAWPPGGALLMVSDGMGGAKAGEEASKLCIERLGAELLARRGEPSPAGALRAAFVATHAALVEAAEADPGKEGMGATLSALWLRAGGAYTIGHVGDSRIYGRQGGAWTQLTEDQSVGAGMLRRGELSADEVNRLRYRSMLEQVMGGDGSPIEPQIAEGRWAPGQEFLLCSDGLHGPVAESITDLASAAFREDSLARGAQALVDCANAAGGPDNITVLLARLVPNSPA